MILGTKPKLTKQNIYLFSHDTCMICRTESPDKYIKTKKFHEIGKTENKGFSMGQILQYLRGIHMHKKKQ